MTLDFEYRTLGAAEPQAAGPVSLRWRLTGVLLGCATALALGFVLGASAQETQAEVPKLDVTGSIDSGQSAPQAAAPAEIDGQIVAQAPGTFAASDLIGEPVSSLDGEPLGTVSDLLLTGDHRVAGVIIGVGGILGFGAKNIGIDIDRVIRAESPNGDQQIVLDFNQEELKQAPEFVSLADQREAAEAEAAQRAQQKALKAVGQPKAPADATAVTQ